MPTTRSKAADAGKATNGSPTRTRASNGRFKKEKSSKTKAETKETATNAFQVVLPKRIVVMSLLLCMVLAFAVGRTARIVLLVNPQKELLKAAAIAQSSSSSSEVPQMKSLPNPRMKDGKQPPETIYTSKVTTGMGNTGSSQSRWIVTEAGKEQCVDLPEHECRAKNDDAPSVDETAAANITDGEVHLPAGQHLLMDIENVNESFLNSEERLAHAMLELVGECGLTLLSYHCHKMIPMGVSCAGVLLESHVSFHTWPKEGVITLDLYTCGPNSLLPIVPLAEKLFAVPRGEANWEEPNTVWAHKTRGYPEGDQQSIEAELTDMEYFPVGQLTDFKEEVAFVKTNFQRVYIYDVLLPNVQSVDSYKKSLNKEEESYESKNPELFRPDRIVYLDGVLQSRRSGEAAYHETLIHPSMFAHKNPKRVAIIGGGEGASLREVLKHKTVENVTMIEIDEMMVSASRKYIPSWSDCSMLEGSAPSCFDDSRVEVQYRDAFQWFIDNFLTNDKPLVEPFDVIIMDALDPQIQKDFVNALYDDDGPFLNAIPKALSEDGIFISQVGESPTLKDPGEQWTEDRNRYRLVKSLAKLGFTTIRSYGDNGSSGFSFPWQFVTAFKNPDTKADWFANPSLVNLKIRARSIPTVDGKSPFKFFDGATMQSYYYPNKQIEKVYCLDGPDSKHCRTGHGFDIEREHLPLSSTLEVKESGAGENAGKGVFSKVDIPKDSYVGLQEHVSAAVFGDPQTYETFMKTSQLNGGKLQGSALGSYVHKYGELVSHGGKESFVVDSTIRSFTNHACDGNNNVGVKMSVSQHSADPEKVPQEVIERHVDLESIYNPAADRQVSSYARATPLKDIKKGEEHLDNYLAFSGKSRWGADVSELRNVCVLGA